MIISDAKDGEEDPVVAEEAAAIAAVNLEIAAEHKREADAEAVFAEAAIQQLKSSIR